MPPPYRCQEMQKPVQRREKVLSNAAQFIRIFFVLPDLLIFKISVKNQAHRFSRINEEKPLESQGFQRFWWR